MATARRLRRGLLAGLAGTAPMTAWQELSSRLVSSGTEDSPEEEAPPADPWQRASVPAKAARRIAIKLLDVDPPPSLIPYLTHGMHWAYGTGWGGVYALVRRRRAESPLRAGAAFGAAVWAGSYAQLVPMGLYAPPWSYSPSEIALDLAYHVAYGVGVAAAYRP